jgi:hypothetical protein
MAALEPIAGKSLLKDTCESLRWFVVVSFILKQFKM